MLNLSLPKARHERVGVRASPLGRCLNQDLHDLRIFKMMEIPNPANPFVLIILIGLTQSSKNPLPLRGRVRVGVKSSTA